MARTKGTYGLSANIEPNASAPLDAREKVALLSDLTAANTFPYPYEGMEVYVVENKKRYTLIGADPTVSANWQENGGGGGGSVDWDDIQNKPESFPPSVHDQAASTITAGTLAGKVQANATSQATLSDAQVRDIIISPTDLNPGSSTLPAGTLYFVYNI